MITPLVSIMMPTYNTEKFIREAILSVKDQTYQNWELIIVDDKSVDKTVEIAKQTQGDDDRIKIIRLKERIYCAGARNRCLDASKGDVIARLDSDDTQCPGRIEKQVNHLLTTGDDLVTCSMFWQMPNGEMQLQDSGAMIPESYLKGKGGRPVNASIIAWTYVYDKVRFEESYHAGSDGEWNFRCILAGYKWGYIKEPMYYYRRHNQQITRRLSGQQQRTHAEAVKKYGQMDLPT